VGKKIKKDINKEKLSRIIFLSLIILLTIITFCNSLFNEFINYDDPGYITENDLIRGLSFQNLKLILSSFVMGNYHPFVVLCDAIVYYFFRLNPIPYHCLSLFLHLINIVLVFNLTSLLISKPPATKLLPASGFQLPASALVACLFAIHPMHCETVCWASDHKDLLFTLFYLLSLIYYIKYLKFTDQSPQAMDRGKRSEVRSQKKNYLIALLFFVCSCLSKSAAVTLPLVMLVTDYFIKRKMSLKSAFEKIPFFILSIAFGIINIYSQSSAKAISDLSNYNIIDKICFPLYSISYYLISLIFPYKLSVNHPYPDKTNNLLPSEYYIFPVIILILLFSVIWIIIKQNKQNTKINKQNLSYIIFGFLFFIINIVLVLQIIPVGWSVVSERYTYLSYLGLFFIIGQFYIKIYTVKRRNLINIIVLLIIIIFSFISHERNKVWANNLSIYDDVINKYPRAFFAYGNRGLAKDDSGDYSGALEDYNIAIGLNSRNAEVNNNRGLVKDHLKDFTGAIADYTKAIEFNSKYAEAFVGRGNAKNSLGDYKEAIKDYNNAIEINPKFAKAFYNMGVAKAFLNDMRGALNDFNRAIEINPQYTEAYNNRGNTKGSLGDLQGAINDFTKSIEINPQNGEAFDNRGKAKYALGDKEGACSDWNNAGELGFTEAYDMMKKYCK
jgi:protein O-mannosyl-transferase